VAFVGNAFGLWCVGVAYEVVGSMVKEDSSAVAILMVLIIYKSQMHSQTIGGHSRTGPEDPAYSANPPPRADNNINTDTLILYISMWLLIKLYSSIICTPLICYIHTYIYICTS